MKKALIFLAAAIGLISATAIYERDIYLIANRLLHKNDGAFHGLHIVPDEGMIIRTSRTKTSLYFMHGIGPDGSLSFIYFDEGLPKCLPECSEALEKYELLSSKSIHVAGEHTTQLRFRSRSNAEEYAIATPLPQKNILILYTGPEKNYSLFSNVKFLEM